MLMIHAATKGCVWVFGPDVLVGHFDIYGLCYYLRWCGCPLGHHPKLCQCQWTMLLPEAMLMPMVSLWSVLQTESMLISMDWGAAGVHISDHDPC